MIVISAPRLLSQEARLDKTLLRERRTIAWIVEESLVDRSCHGVVDIVADEVHELERTHAKLPELSHRPIDRGHVGDAFLQNAKGFAVERPRDAIHDETGRIRRHDWCLSPLLHE